MAIMAMRVVTDALLGCAGGGRPSWLLRPLLIDLLSQPPAWLMADCLLLLLQICQLLLFSSDTHTILYMNVLYLYLCYILPLPRCIAIVYKTSMTHVYIVYQMKKHIFTSISLEQYKKTLGKYFSRTIIQKNVEQNERGNINFR